MFALLMVLLAISDDGKMPDVCVQELQQQLAVEQLNLSTRNCDLAVHGSNERVVVIRRGQETLLRREVGKGTCEQASKAAMVIVKRWLTSIGQLDSEAQRQPVVVSQPVLPPQKRSEPPPKAAPVVTVPTTLDPLRVPTRETPSRAESPAPPVVVALVDRAPLVPASDSRGAVPPAETKTNTSSTQESPTPEIPVRNAEVKSTIESRPIEQIQNKPANTDTGSANLRQNRVAEAKHPASEPPRLSAAESEVPSSAPAEPPPSPPPLPPPETVEQVSPLRIEVTHLEALVGGGVVTPAASGAGTPLLGIDLSLTLNRRIRIPLWGAYDFGGSLPIVDEKGFTRGSFTTQGWYAAPGAMVCTDTALRACGGVMVGAKILQAEASGDFVFQRKSAVAPEFLVAPAVQVAWLLGRFEVAVDASLIATPVPAVFAVDGLPTRVVTPQFQGLFRLSVGAGSI